MNETIQSLMESLSGDPTFSQWLELINDPIMVLNPDLKVVTANHALLQLINVPDARAIVGQSPLKAINCQFMSGTIAEHNIKIATSLRNLQDATPYSEECSLIAHDGRWLHFRIQLKNYNFQGSELIIMLMRDIADEKHRDSLERIFFNDLINTASALYSLLSITANTPENAKNMIPRLVNLAQGLLDDIDSQRDLRLAQQKEIIPERISFDANELVQELASYLGQADFAENKKLIINDPTEPLRLFTDRRLLRRVLHNMLKNALEATPSGATVSVTTSTVEDKIKFSIQNPGVIAPEIAKRIFEPFYSTKGKGRGGGTYGMKLLTERYLNGEIKFETSAENGTIFTAIYPMNA